MKHIGLNLEHFNYNNVNCQPAISETNLFNEQKNGLWECNSLCLRYKKDIIFPGVFYTGTGTPTYFFDILITLMKNSVEVNGE
jgi:hypothetical protein